MYLNTKLWPILCQICHDDVIKWKHFQRYWPFVRGNHRSRWIPRTKASNAELFFLRLNERLSKQSWDWWFEMLPHPLWRHCNGSHSSHRQYRDHRCTSSTYQWIESSALSCRYNDSQFFLSTSSLETPNYSTMTVASVMYHLISQCIGPYCYGTKV